MNEEQNTKVFANTLNDMANRLKANASAIEKEGLTSELLRNVAQISKYIVTGVELKTFDGHEYTDESFLPENMEYQTVYYEENASSSPKKFGSDNYFDDFK